MVDLEQKDFKEFVDKMSAYRGRHTELITVLVPAGATLTQTTKQLEDEKGLKKSVIRCRFKARFGQV